MFVHVEGVDGRDSGDMETINWANLTVRLGDLKPWEHNPKSISKAHARRLLASWEKFGQFQTVAIGPDCEVYDGHQRLSVLRAAHGDGYQVDARQSSRALTDEERRQLVIEAHAGTTGQFDWDALANWDAAELQEWGLDELTQKDWKRDIAALGELLKSQDEAAEQSEETPEDEPLFYRVPDAVWGTDNDYGIPLLDATLQATCLEAPFAGWGTMPRKTRMTGTWHFYVEDYRFEALWRNPLDVVNSACNAIVEPNFSVYDDMPRAVALWQMYRKRWITRWVQSCGIPVFVDLNISWKYADLRFLGVPRGWKAYATRAYSDRLNETEMEYKAACEHAGTDAILFVVYGGGKKAEELSKQHGWIWYMDQQTKDAGGKNG